MKLYCDNHVVLCIGSSPEFQIRTKHIDKDL